jgi:hypothetical protein
MLTNKLLYHDQIYDNIKILALRDYLCQRTQLSKIKSEKVEKNQTIKLYTNNSDASKRSNLSSEPLHNQTCTDEYHNQNLRNLAYGNYHDITYIYIYIDSTIDTDNKQQDKVAPTHKIK